MDFEPESADVSFRLEVRTFLEEKLDELFPDRPRGIGSSWATRADMRKWMQALDQKGWAVPHWPLEWGGTGWSPTRRAIFDDEVSVAGCPPRDMISIGFVGPVIHTFGTDEQRRRFLPRIRSAEDAWCQGFSEAGAGSDVMSLRATAARQGDRFFVNGRKLWISHAHTATMMFALVRIVAPGNRRQQGLSFLLLDMASPGVTVRPVILIDGSHLVNEVALENVSVPVENLVGEQGKGWVYARFLLDRERSLVAQLSTARRLVGALRRALATQRRCGVPLIEEPTYRLKLAELEVELAALEFLELRFLSARDDDASAQVLASMLKLRGTELRQRASEALWDALGDRGLEFPVRQEGLGCAGDSDERPDIEKHWIAQNYLFQRSATLAGGTSEIQHNIIAAVALGL